MFSQIYLYVNKQIKYDNYKIKSFVGFITPFFGFEDKTLFPTHGPKGPFWTIF